MFLGIADLSPFADDRDESFRRSMVSEPAQFIFARQTLWAARHGHALRGSAGTRGRFAYTRHPHGQPVRAAHAGGAEDFAGGDGGELGRGGAIPGKMQAVHSSSALSCNLFHYWRRIGRPDIIAKACGFPVS